MPEILLEREETIDGITPPSIGLLKKREENKEEKTEKTNKDNEKGNLIEDKLVIKLKARAKTDDNTDSKIIVKEGEKPVKKVKTAAALVDYSDDD